jgi:hypothetical protein
MTTSSRSILGPGRCYGVAVDMQTYTDLAARYEAIATDARAVARLFVEAMLALERDEAAATQAMVRMCSTRSLDPAPSEPSGHCFRASEREAVKRLLRDPNIARSYCGGRHEHDYALDLAAPRVVLDEAYSARGQGVDYPRPGEAKLFVASGGADLPRPILLARNASGQWKVTNWSSLTTGVRKPASSAGNF